MKTTLEGVAARIRAATATLAETSGGALLAVRAERLDGMAQMLAGLGRPFTVIALAELRDEIRALATRLLASADASPP
ncbi:WYL domain-containing protein [Streptosporangium oxazolinicum]